MDGVLNAVTCGRKPPPDAFDDLTLTKCIGFKIRYSPKMGARLAALDADIVWLTTWRGFANAKIAPLFRWQPMPVLDSKDDDGVQLQGWWKSEAADAYLMANPRPFVWIDDDLQWSIGNGDVEWHDGTGADSFMVFDTASLAISSPL